MDDPDIAGWSEPTIASVAGLESMRVLRIARFLPKHERDALFDAVCANQKAFRRPGIAGGNEGGSLYLSLESDDLDQVQIDPLYRAGGYLKRRILGLLPTLFTALGVEPFPVSKLSLTLMNGMDGHRGSPHADDSGDRFKISLLYYFHRTPKAFRGGDLAFYDADPASPNGHSDEARAKIDHEDNLLIAFPSHVFHGITDVRCDSDAFPDGRFVAIAFLGPQ